MAGRAAAGSAAGGQCPLWLAAAIFLALSSCAIREPFEDESGSTPSIRDEAATDEAGERVLGRALLRQARDEAAVLAQPALNLPLESLAASRPPRSLAQEAAADLAASTASGGATGSAAGGATGSARENAAGVAGSAQAPLPGDGASPPEASAAGAEPPVLFRRLFGWIRGRAADDGSPGGESAPSATESAGRAAGEPPAAAATSVAIPAPPAPSASVPPPATAPVDARVALVPPRPADPVEVPAAPAAVPAPPVAPTPAPDGPASRAAADSPTVTAALRPDIDPVMADVEPLNGATLDRGNFATLMGAMYGMVERCDGQTTMREQALKSFRSTYAMIDLDRRQMSDAELRRRSDGDFERSVTAARIGGQVNCDYVRAQSYRWTELAADLRRMDRESALQYRQGLITEIRRGAGLAGFN